MDLNWIRIAVTLVSFAAFVGIVVWAWSRRRRADFHEAEQLPFVDDMRVPAFRADRTAAAVAAVNKDAP